MDKINLDGFTPIVGRSHELIGKVKLWLGTAIEDEAQRLSEEILWDVISTIHPQQGVIIGFVIYMRTGVIGQWNQSFAFAPLNPDITQENVAELARQRVSEALQARSQLLAQQPQPNPRLS